MANTKHVGNAGEGEAVSYLEKNGYKILEKNYRAKFGEIDIVVSKNREIIFVEVKSRIAARGVDGAAFLPEDNIDQRKREKLRKLGEYYLSVHNYPEDQAWQIDVVTVEMDQASKKIVIRHIEQAVTG